MQKSRGFKQDARLEATIDLDLPCLDGRMVLFRLPPNHIGELPYRSHLCGIISGTPLRGLSFGSLEVCLHKSILPSS